MQYVMMNIILLLLQYINYLLAPIHKAYKSQKSIASYNEQSVLLLNIHSDILEFVYFTTVIICIDIQGKTFTWLQRGIIMIRSCVASFISSGSNTPSPFLLCTEQEIKFLWNWIGNIHQRTIFMLLNHHIFEGISWFAFNMKTWSQSIVVATIMDAKANGFCPIREKYIKVGVHFIGIFWVNANFHLCYNISGGFLFGIHLDTE